MRFGTFNSDSLSSYFEPRTVGLGLRLFGYRPLLLRFEIDPFLIIKV